MDLPISKDAAIAATQWLKQHFGSDMDQATSGTVFNTNHLCGIVCQESAYRWLGWRKTQTVEKVLACCVLDGSGDVPGTSRSAFPKNTAAFRAKYGDEFTEKLVAAGNAMRKLMGWGSVDWIYKGYGIFQYDLQFVKEDESYFRKKQWGDFSVCLNRVMGELDTTWKWVQKNHSDKPKQEQIRLAIRKYNGSGARAEAYSHNVMFYTKIASQV